MFVSAVDLCALVDLQVWENRVYASRLAVVGTSTVEPTGFSELEMDPIFLWRFVDGKPAFSRNQPDGNIASRVIC